MPKFSIEGLLIATAMVAIGFTSALIASLHGQSIQKGIQLLMYYGGSMLVGAGLLVPVKRPYLGAALGLVGGVAVLFIRLVFFFPSFL
jgi:hypothetical protein